MRCRLRYSADNGEEAIITMNQTELENFLDSLYQRQTKRLSKIELVDVLHQETPYLFHVLGIPGTAKITTKLLDIYMDSFNEALVLTRDSTSYIRFRQAFHKEQAGDPNFYIRLISLMGNYASQHRLEFEQEWDKALNRFERDFLNNFGNPDGSIDWEKLVRFNSGKDKVAWISSDE